MSELNLHLRLFPKLSEDQPWLHKLDFILSTIFFIYLINSFGFLSIFDFFGNLYKKVFLPKESVLPFKRCFNAHRLLISALLNCFDVRGVCEETRRDGRQYGYFLLIYFFTSTRFTCTNIYPFFFKPAI